MSFSQELKDFVAGANTGAQLYNQSAKNAVDQQKAAAEAKYYNALEKNNDARTPHSTPPINQDFIEEGRHIYGPGGTGLPNAAMGDGEAGTGEWWTPERMRYAANYLETKAGLSPYGASGIVARWAGIESRGKGPTSANAAGGGDGAFGVGQWRGDRLAPIKGNGDFDAQLQHAALELTPGTKEAQIAGTTDAIKLLRAARSKEDAARGASMFERAEGYDPKTGIDNFTWKTPVDRVYNTIYGQRSAIPAAACGGMIHRYEDGGAVEQQKPYYAEDLMSDVGNALGKLGDVVRGGFQSISDTFGLHERPAVAQADPNYMKRVEAYTRDPGADPQQVQEVKRSVDPNGELDDALATTYGMVKSYEYHLKNGNQEAANKAAGQILLYTRMKSQQLGALAVHALQDGDETTATKAIQQAYNFLPNSQKLEMQDGKAILVDQKSGKPIREVNFTPATLLKAAYGFTNGEAFLNDLSDVMQSEKEKVAGIKAQSAIEVANTNAGAKTDAATITTEGRKDVAHTKADSAVNVANIGADARRDVAGTNKESHLEGIDKQQSGENQRNAATNQTRVDVANVNQGGANYRAGVAADTSTANNKNTNETNERIAGVKVEGQKDVANTKAGAAVDVANINQTGQNQRNAATNETRKDIAEGRNETSRANNVTNNQTKLQTTMDVLDAKTSEGDKNRASREGIAGAKIASSEKQTGEKITSQEKRTGERLAAQKEIAAAHDATSINNNNNRIDAAAANKALDIDAKKAITDAANQENDRRVGRKAALTRQNSQLTAIDKMTNHALLGVDEMTTPNVSASQAQATRDIARGIVESSGSKIAGDQAASYARQMTRFDKATGRPVVQLKLNPADRSVTMPDGTTLPLSEGAFAVVSKIHGGAQ